MHHHHVLHRRRTSQHGFSLIELLAATLVFVLAALLGSSYIARTASELTQSGDELFARQKALAILAEIRALAARGELEVAADLDGLDDGGAILPNLSVMRDPYTGDFVVPDHPISANVSQLDGWRWGRSLAIEQFGTDRTKDRRLVTVRMYRVPIHSQEPEQVVQITGVVQTLPDVHVARQVLDLYVLAIENVPSLWTSPDQLPTLVSNTIEDAERRNPGLRFRVHWVTQMGYGRDPEYAPHGNASPRSDEKMELAYYYPGRLPDGASQRLLYSPRAIGGRLNIDFAGGPALQNGYEEPEPFEDANGNGRLDGGEYYIDSDGDDQWDPGNTHPYALADMHNHAKRYPEALEHFEARVAAGNDSRRGPTWRLLLDGMIQEPERFRNALILNTHGSLLPLPPVRNYSDAASSPGVREGWRVVTHPELLLPRRVAGNDAASDAPRFRVYAYRTAFDDDEVVMALPESFEDDNGNGIQDGKEKYDDLNGNGRWDEGLPITLTIPGADVASGANVIGAETLVVKCLRGGVDADDDGSREPYDGTFVHAPRLPEPFTDTNGNGICEIAERYIDLNGNGVRDDFEPYEEVDGNGVFTALGEAHVDSLSNGRYDGAEPAESYKDDNGNGRWDDAEPYWDYDGDGKWTKPDKGAGVRQPWNPEHYGNDVATRAYIAANGEPFLDLDGDGEHDDQPEDFDDRNGNGRRDGGFERGDMFFTATYDAAADRSIVRLFGTPLETPPTPDGRGLDPRFRLYDYDYVPCPTPTSADAEDRFGRDLAHPDANVPKNTARWTLEIPVPALRRAWESKPGANDGDLRDRILTVETRMGMDADVGVMWPLPQDPQNVSRTFAYYYADPERVPYSERYQFQGDPRHMPYADLDARGGSFPNAYNPYFDDLRVAGVPEASQPTGRWAAFDWSRLSNGWAGRTDFDLPRYLAWVRTALARSGALYTTLGGSFLEYVSLGGDIALLDADGRAVGAPVDGRPFGQGGVLSVSTLGTVGSAEASGSRTYARATKWKDAGRRDGGTWWAKPWLGELFPDEVYFEQWSWYGNLLADKKEDTRKFRQGLRMDMPAAQLPDGTGALAPARAELGVLGMPAFFAAGSDGSTLRQRRAGASADVVLDGLDVTQEFGFEFTTPLPGVATFGLGWGPVGNVAGFTAPPEWNLPEFAPRWAVMPFVTHATTVTGNPPELVSAGVRHTSPEGALGRILVTGLGTGGTTQEGDLIRFGLCSLLNAHAKEGLPGTPERIRQLPRVKFEAPVPGTILDDPDAITLQWTLDWNRWDGRPYQDLYPEGFAEPQDGLVFVPLISDDFGETWRSMMDGSWVREGECPRLDDGRPDPTRVLQGADRVAEFSMAVPPEDYPAGVYIVRLEVHDVVHGLHYAYKTERIDVHR